MNARENGTAGNQRTLYENGTVLTLDNEEETHEALVVEGSNIVGVGSVDDMRTLAGRDSDRVDLDGSFVLPGLIDSHPHAMHFAGWSVGAVDILDATCFDDIVKAIQERAAITPKGEWIICTPVGIPGDHYFIKRSYLDLAERRLPDRHVLDFAAPDHPVHIMACSPKTPNAVSFNSLALKTLGIGRGLPERVGELEIEKDDDTGEPTGILRGRVNNYYSHDPLWCSIQSKLPQMPKELWEFAGIEGIQQANATGVTGLLENHCMYPEHIEGYQRLRDKGFCTARVMNMLELSDYALDLSMTYDDDMIRKSLDVGAALTQTSDDFMRINGVVHSRGGPLSHGYLRMHEPYVGPFGEMTRGKTFVGRHMEREVMQYCLDNDLRLSMVLGGYRDVDDWLQTVDEVASNVDLKTREWILQHCYFTTPKQVEAFKKHGFQITTSSSFVFAKADVVRERIGEWALKDFIAMRRYLEEGLTMGCGSDWGPGNPWELMALNETRECCITGHRHLEYDQSISRLQSLQASTRNPAKIMQWDGIGQLKPGYKADLAIVDRNPLEVSAENLVDTQVLRTVVDGVGVFDAGGLKGGRLNIRPTAQQALAEAMASAAKASAGKTAEPAFA